MQLICILYRNKTERKSYDTLMLNEENKFNWWNKYLLSVEEAAQYFGIGEKRLREYISRHHNADFIVLNGTKTLIKKKMFERYIDTQMSVI